VEFTFSSIKAKIIKHKTLIISSWLIKTLIMLAIFGFTQDPAKKTDVVQIKTSLQCKMCRDKITNGLIYEKGIKDVTVDIPAKTVTVKYNTKQTTPDKIREKITKLGYDADNMPADPKSYEKLPPCCKKDAAEHKD
jgi:periplasmic mercuric ion binding protein